MQEKEKEEKKVEKCRLIAETRDAHIKMKTTFEIIIKSVIYSQQRAWKLKMRKLFRGKG